MKTIKKEKILSEIFAKKTQLDKLEPYIKVSKMSNDFYNKILIEKAVLKAKLKKLEKPNVFKIFTDLFTPKTKLISDYFKDNCPMV